MTVSRVLRGQGEASEETRARIVAAARELGYVPVPPPTVQNRRLQTRIIGVMFDGLHFEDFWGLPMYRGMREAAEDHYYDLLTVRRRRPPDWPAEREETRFLDRRCDAFVFVAPFNRYDLMETLIRNDFPVVSCAVEEVPPGVGYVAGDNEGVMRQAVEHLMQSGHRRIGYLAHWQERSYFKRRDVGFRAAMAEAGLDPNWHSIVEHPDCLSGARNMAQLAAGGEITAVACANDFCALRLWEQAEVLGLRVPRDLSIIGIDDIPEAMQRGLTSFRASSENMGRLTIDAAVAALEGAAPWQRIEPFHIVPRVSVAKPRKIRESAVT